MNRQKHPFTAGVTLAIVLCVVGHLVAKERFRYGVILRNVTCNTQTSRGRQKYVSQVFSYCPSDISRPGLVEETRRDFETAIRATCGTAYDITFEDVLASDSESEASHDRQTQLTESGYAKHISVYALVNHYSSKCQ
jgi:hypothetical protein